jgi:hypothetical protein
LKLELAVNNPRRRGKFSKEKKNKNKRQKEYPEKE